jgi:hypothetical protein
MEELTKKQKLKLKAKNSAKKLKRELKKSVLIAITAAFGFLIALSWKELITELVKSISAINPLQGKIIEAITVTLISVLGILIITKLFEEKSDSE